jgi:ankyrin repeat protein
MVQQAPSATLVPNANGSLPIHLALSVKEPSLKVVRLLVQQSPESLRVANNAGLLPLQIAVSRSNCSLKMVRLLAEPFPGALKACDGNGLLPLQVAAANGASLDVLFYLATKFPAAAAPARAGGGNGSVVA